MEWKQVLVGVDGSPASRRALEWAHSEASRHGCELVAVTAWSPLPPPMGTTTTVPTHGIDDPAGTAKEILDETLSEVLPEPEVDVRTVVEEGNAAKVLIEHSPEADLLVVGTRGHGGFAGLLLGSVSQHVTAHAQCAVTVVR